VTLEEALEMCYIENTKGKPQAATSLMN